MDSALRSHFLVCLDRDLRFAALGILGDLIMPTRWGSIRRLWRGESFRANIVMHGTPPGPPMPRIGFGAPPAGGMLG